HSINSQSYDRHPMHDIVPKRSRYFLPPWVTEGDATFASGGRSSLGDMYVRYLVNSGEVSYGLKEMLRAPRSLTSYFLGSEFWRFLGADTDSETMDRLRRLERGIFSRMRMGDSLRVRFLKDQSLYSSPGEALEEIYGVSLGELDAAFRLYLNLRFGRDYTRTADATMFADRLTESPGDWYDRPYLAPLRAIESHTNEAVTDTIVDMYYTAANDGYEAIYVRSLRYRPLPPNPPDPALFDACLRRRPGDCVEFGETPPGRETGEAGPEDLEEEYAVGRNAPHWNARKVVRAGTEDCQTLDIRSNRIDVYQDDESRLLTYTCTDSRRQTKVLGVFDLDLDREIERYPLAGLGTLRSPTWSPDGRSIAFSGIANSGTSDLYVIDRQDGSLEKLTDDVYADGELDWSPDGRWIVFSSDRGPFGDHSRGRTHANLYLLDVTTREIVFLTYGDWIDLAPTWSPDGSRVLFASDRGGAFDLYVVDRNGEGRKLTNVSTGILSAQWWPDGQSIVFTAFDGGQQIYRMQTDYADDPEEAPFRELIALGEPFAKGGFERTWTQSWSWEDNLGHALVQMAEPSSVADRYHVSLGGASGEWSTGVSLAGVSLFFTNRDHSRLIYTSFQSSRGVPGVGRERLRTSRTCMQRSDT
ncbi:MAG: TolB family protein, partial [Gemmatimonadota bacterium]